MATMRSGISHIDTSTVYRRVTPNTARALLALQRTVNRTK